MTEDLVTLTETAPVALSAQLGSGTGFLVIDPVPPGETVGSPPVITVTPTPGTPLSRNDFVTIDIVDPTGLRRGELFVTLGIDTFVVHDGGSFRGKFSNFSTRTVIADGFRHVVRPNGGWKNAPRFEVHAVDTDGNEA